MTSEETNNCEIIDELIRQGRSFAMYRNPGEEEPHFLMQTYGEVRLVREMEELNGQTGFVIAPFRVTPQCPIILIQPDCQEIPSCAGSPRRSVQPVCTEVCSLSAQNERPVRAKEAYAACFDIFIRALRAHTFDKLVLSRKVTVKKEPGFSPASAFYKACRRYIYSYVYLCYTPQTGVWMGSTPEIIISGEKGEWNTVALAGTQSLQNGELPQHWDEKNREEQEYVAAYIRNQLRSLGISPVEKGPYPAFAGALSHLKTDFRFSLNDSRKLGDLLKLLHPTPAVCGLPKEEAYRFILDNEGYDRSYYSGFIGWLKPEGKTDLYVNLRCMNVKEDTLTLYAGGGLLASSELDDEFQETEKKMQTMKNLNSL